MRGLKRKGKGERDLLLFCRLCYWCSAFFVTFFLTTPELDSSSIESQSNIATLTVIPSKHVCVCAHLQFAYLPKISCSNYTSCPQRHTNYMHIHTTLTFSPGPSPPLITYASMLPSLPPLPHHVFSEDALY